MKRLLSMAVVVLIVVCTGCMTVDMGITVSPDMSAEVGVKITAPIEMAEQIEDFGTLPDMDDVAVEDTETTRTVSGKKLLGPDEAFDAGEDGAGPSIIRQQVRHRLSTHYIFAMELPTDNPLAPEEDADDEQELDPGQLAAMMSGLMATFKIDVTVRLPGQIVSTTGEIVGTDTAVFHLTMQDLSNADSPKLTAVSKMPDFTALGQLTDEVVASGTLWTIARDDLPLYLEAGLLPDPPQNADGQYALAAADYGRLAQLIAALRAALPDDMVKAVVEQLGLNRDTTSSDEIARAADAVSGIDLDELVLQTVLSSLRQ
jgi:hypothetical protein